jgi:hypothetical protein
MCPDVAWLTRAPEAMDVTRPRRSRNRRLHWVALVGLRGRFAARLRPVQSSSKGRMESIPVRLDKRRGVLESQPGRFPLLAAIAAVRQGTPPHVAGRVYVPTALTRAEPAISASVATGSGLPAQCLLQVTRRTLGLLVPARAGASGSVADADRRPRAGRGSVIVGAGGPGATR